ncbi:hypothetical protein PENTCL1PPCAC_21331, partial [Pristionchus entomophagus]
ALMAKGRKCPTPTDPNELASYRMRRDKNNESAMKHRERTRQTVIQHQKLKEEHDRIIVEFEQAKLRIEELKKEKQLLLDYLLTHECVSSKAIREQLLSSSNLEKSAFQVVLPDTNRIQAASASIAPINNTVNEPFLSSKTQLQPHQTIGNNTNFFLSTFPAREARIVPPLTYSIPNFHSPVCSYGLPSTSSQILTPPFTPVGENLSVSELLLNTLSNSDYLHI